MVVTDQDLINFVVALKGSSNYDLSEYSDKSLKRRLQKVLADFNVDMAGLISSVKNYPVFAYFF